MEPVRGSAERGWRLIEEAAETPVGCWRVVLALPEGPLAQRVEAVWASAGFGCFEEEEILPRSRTEVLFGLGERHWLRDRSSPAGDRAFDRSFVSGLRRPGTIRRRRRGMFSGIDSSRGRWHLAAVALILALGPASVPPAAAAEAPRPVADDLPRHELVFARHSDASRQDYDLWRMCADGTQLASLVVEPGHQFQISVSPDGEAFLYTSPVEGKRDVFRRPFGRGEAENLTNHPANDSSPAWSPDGGRVAFFSDRDAEKPELYLLVLESGAITRLTRNELYESGASWFPDGERIAFTRFFRDPEGGEHDGRGEVFLLDLATGEETQLTRLGGYNGDLAVSPDGSKIAFHRTADGGSEIWIVEADGSDPRAVTATFVDEYSPEWSPDGRWIAFTAGVGHDGLGTFDLWLMRPDGTDRRLVNPAANTEAWHEWRPGEHYCR